MKKIGLFLLMIIITSSGVLAFGPNSHNRIFDIVQEELGENQILEMCYDRGDNERALRAGTVIPDISVIFYYTEGGKDYKLLHNWNFQQETLSRALTEDEKCFAYGIAFHLIMDSVSHNELVSDRISSTRVPNWLLHPLVEKKWDSGLSKNHKELAEETSNMLSVMFTPKGERYIEMMDFSVGENIEFDILKETTNLAAALNTFYEDIYRPTKEENSLFTVYPLIDKFTNFIEPVVGGVNERELNANMDRTAQLVINTFDNWGTRNSLSPHGFSQLQIANEKATYLIPLTLILMILLFITVPIIMVWRTKNFLWSLIFLGIIPAILLWITIIYAIV